MLFLVREMEKILRRNNLNQIVMQSISRLTISVRIVQFGDKNSVESCVKIYTADKSYVNIVTGLL